MLDDVLNDARSYWERRQAIQKPKNRLPGENRAMHRQRIKQERKQAKENL